MNIIIYILLGGLILFGVLYFINQDDFPGYPDGAPVEVYPGIIMGATEPELNLSGRELTDSLKAEIRNLEVVVEIDLSNNKFTGLPAEVGQLIYLETLNLSNNQLTGLPHELGNLKNLKTLDLRGNNISEFDLETIRERLPESTQILSD